MEANKERLNVQFFLKLCSENPDNTLQSQYPCGHVFGLQSDSILLSRFAEEFMNYSLYSLGCSPWRRKRQNYL